MGVELRGEVELHADDEVVIHMGAGAVETVTTSAILNWHQYRGIKDRRGAFTVSVFGAIKDVSERDIIDRLPQKQFGRASYGDLKTTCEQAHLDIWPTTITDTGNEEIEKLQHVHFDIVLPDDAVDTAGADNLTDWSDDDLRPVREALRPSGVDLLEVFKPRLPKPRGG